MVFLYRKVEILACLLRRVLLVVYLAVSHVAEKLFKHEVQNRAVFRAFKSAVLALSQRQNIVEIVCVRTPENVSSLLTLVRPTK